MPLHEYHRKRDFSRTPEPKGTARARPSGALFVVQKHSARRLHYDFRLELDGVLKSWAVPKGPTLDPRQKRLAVEVEDHPLEYGQFEGVIPEGEYGGGTVLLWDRGTWTPLVDPRDGLRQGKLKFELHGEKLQGEWVLLRTGKPGGKDWLLKKIQDEKARSEEEFDVLGHSPKSAASGRSMAQVAKARDRVWSSKAAEAPASDRKQRTPDGRGKSTKAAIKASNAKTTAGALAPKRIGGAKKAAMPETIEPALATLTSEPPVGQQWLNEIKLDGYRMLCRIQAGRATLLTRRQQDWTQRFALVAEAAAELPCREAVVDGEIVALLPNGVSSFQALQNALQEDREERLVYHLFDLLYLDGYDLRTAALEDRKSALARLIAGVDTRGPLRYTEHILGNGKEFFGQCCRMGLEGMIAKRRDRPYPAGRTPDWVKVKCTLQQEFVLGGYADSLDRKRRLGSILVGYYDDQGQLRYAGRVGTGWNAHSLAELYRRLAPLGQQAPPFADFPRREIRRGVHWVRPELVAEVSFSNWTEDGRLRHPSFQGLREDQPARSIRREVPAAKIETATRKKRPAAKTGSSTPKDMDLERQLGGVHLTNPDRVLYPEQGVTKLGLAAFYVQIRDWVLPHIIGRPLSLVRCPEGEGKECFYQKHVKEGVPEALNRIAIREEKATREYLVVEDLAGLVSLVQMAVLEIHPWGARTDNVDLPDRVVFDLDPDPTVDWSRVIEAAHRLRRMLEQLGLASFVKTTGGKGLHVVVPIQRRLEWPAIKEFARAVVHQLSTDQPGQFTVNMAKAARRGKIFLDYLRNDRGATAVAAYSTRARPGAPVSTPLAWEELSQALRSDHFTIDNLSGRLQSLSGDPWDGFFTLRQSIRPSALRKLGI